MSHRKRLKTRHSNWSPLFRTAVFAAITATLSFSYFLAKNHGLLSIGSDFDRQQMPFTMALIDQIHRGGLTGWMWSLDMGSGVIPSFSFYELGSPFFWAACAFPSAWFPRLVPFYYVSKYILAAVTAHVYVRMFVRDESYATVGGLLYAFSGFQTTNLLFYHFHDVVAVFPLLLIGVERLMRDKADWLPLTLASFVNCLVNYVFFIQSAMLVMLYWLFRFAPQGRLVGWQETLACLLRCLLAGALGAAMASVLLVPSIFYIASHPRAATTHLSLQNLVWPSNMLLFIIKGMLLPGENMGPQSILLESRNYQSVGLWLPFIGPSFALAYVRENRDWLSRLILAFVLISLSPLLCSAFMFFSAIYLRWWYGLALMGALASALALGQLSDRKLRDAALTVFFATAAFCLVIAVLPYSAEGELAVYDARRFALYAALGLVGPLSMVLWPRIAKRLSSPIGCALICCCAVANMGFTLHNYRAEGARECSITLTHEWYEVSRRIDTGDEQYRFALADNRFTLTGGLSGTSSFCSTISEPLFRVDGLLDHKNRVTHSIKDSSPGFGQALGERYVLHRNGKLVGIIHALEPRDEAGYRALPADGAALSPVQSIHMDSGASYEVFERAACPIGYAIDSYVTKEEFLSLPLEQRGRAFLQAIPLEPETVSKVNGLLSHATLSSLDLTGSIDKLVKTASHRPVHNFSRDDYGFRCEASKGVYFFSVPNDPGWTLRIDGEKASIKDACGLMLVHVPEGHHVLEFSYQTPGLSLGVFMSVCACVVLAGALIIKKVRYTKGMR